MVGLSKGDLHRLSSFHEALRGGRLDEASRSLWELGWPHGPASTLADGLWAAGARGSPRSRPAPPGSSPCSRAADLIRRGDCDLALAGAGDASLDPLPLAAFRQMGALAPVAGRPDRGVAALRPPALRVPRRRGRRRARPRTRGPRPCPGVQPYAEMAGGALGADAYHITDLDPDPSDLAELIRRRSRHAGRRAAEDRPHQPPRHRHPRQRPARMPRHPPGPRPARPTGCPARRTRPRSATSSAPPGAVELAITCLAIRDGFVPPTLNLDDPDPACDLDLTPLVGRPRPIRAALKLSLGFGGHLAAAVLRSPSSMVFHGVGYAHRSAESEKTVGGAPPYGGC